LFGCSLRIERERKRERERDAKAVGPAGGDVFIRFFVVFFKKKIGIFLGAENIKAK
jgi:hypothetical protein